MMIAEEIQNGMKIDKSSWSRVKLGDVVREVRETVKDPEAEEIERVIGLEHLEPESIHIREWGHLSEGTTFTKKFRKGQVLFGRRRAYLKKAALATFDGLCSGDITVLEAKDGLLPELLPFIIQNDKFFHLAVKNSAGSLSPRAKFKDLVDEVFLLPPKEQQTQLAELLWVMDEVIESELVLLKELDVGFKVFRKNLIQNGVRQTENRPQKIQFGEICSSWNTKKLGEFCSLIGGNAFKSGRFKEKGKYQVLRIGNLTDKGFNFEKAPVFLDELEKSEKKYLIPKGAVMVSLTGTNGKRDYGFPSLMLEDKKYLLNQRLVMMIPDEEVMLPEFLYLLAKMEIFQGRFFLNATGTANQANVSISDIEKIELPVPPVDEQEIIIGKMNAFRTGKRTLEARINKSNALKKSILNQIF